MRRLLAGIFLAALVTSGARLPAQAQAGMEKAFDATYEATSGGKNMTMRMVCDGHGRMRMENSTPQGRVVSLIDHPGQVMYTLVEAQKMAMRLPFNPHQASAPSVRDAATARKYNAQPLGAKVIDGHPCHGFRATHQGSTTDSWVGDDIGFLVYSATSSAQGTSTMRLKSYGTGTPSPQLFTVPADYRVMNLPTSIPGMSGMSGGFPGGASRGFGGQGMTGGFPGGGSMPPYGGGVPQMPNIPSMPSMPSGNYDAGD